MKEITQEDYELALKYLPEFIESRLQLVWRYFRDVVEGHTGENGHEKLARYATIKGVEKDDPEKKFSGFITDGYHIKYDDFLAIYDAISEALSKAKEVTRLDLNAKR